MDKKDRYQEFLDLLDVSIKEVKGFKSIEQLNVISDSSFGGIIRLFGRADILQLLAMLVASEIELKKLTEEKLTELINKKLEKRDQTLSVSDTKKEYN